MFPKTVLFTSGIVLLSGFGVTSVVLPQLAPKLSQNEPQILSGRIVKPDGSPATSAKVFLSVMDEHGAYHWLRTSTNPEGKFSVHVSALGQSIFRELNVSAVTPEGIARKQTRYREIESNFVLKLEPAVSLSGRVLRTDGTPVSGVVLSPQGLTDLKPHLNRLVILPDADAKKLLGAKTDAQGRFILQGLPPRTEFQIRCESPLKVAPGSAGSVFTTEKLEQKFGTMTLYRPANLAVHVPKETPISLFRPNLGASEVVLPKFQKDGFFEVTGDFLGERNKRGAMVFQQLFPGEYEVRAGNQIAMVSLEEGQSLTVSRFSPKPKTSVSTVSIPPQKLGEDVYQRNRHLYETPLAFPAPNEVERAKSALSTYNAALATGSLKAVQGLTSPLSFGCSLRKERFLLNVPLRYREEEVVEKPILLRYVPRLWLATLAGLPTSGNRDIFQINGIPNAIAKLGTGANWAIFGGTRKSLSGAEGDTFILAGVLHREAGTWRVVAIPLQFMASQSPEEQLRERWENKIATLRNVNILTTPAKLPEASDLAAAKAALSRPEAVPLTALTVWELQLLALMTGEDERRQLAGDVSYTFPRKELEAGTLAAFETRSKTGRQREIAVVRRNEFPGKMWRLLARLPIE